MKVRHQMFVLSALAMLCLRTPAVARNAVQIKVGDTPPELLGKDVDGREVRLSDYRGKVVVMSFWATWCPPCRKELPILERLQEVGSDRGLQVIAVNWEEEGATFRRAVKILSSFQLKFVSDTSGKVGKSYGVNAIPTMLLIDKDGKVAFMTIGYGESVINSLVPAVNKALGLDDGSSASAGAP